MPAPARHACPVCGRPFTLGEPPKPPGMLGEPPAPDTPRPPFPFCSRACKLVDLGRWLDGSYRVSGPAESALDLDGEAGDRE